MKKKKSLILVVIVCIFAVCGICLACGIINYRSKIPKYNLKKGVHAKVGDTITIDDVAEVSDNMKDWYISAHWEDDSFDGIEFDEKHHTITILSKPKEGSCTLTVGVSVCGSNYEYVGGDMFVVVE
ncbi:MAG: hypothetical protein Q4D54_06195 [Eubacteriales bacterium]|nr:hypothetical protein [Lachnospiraceae bacterium]MDO5127320.1 hypothetical protein [Eubacteriales bacterium]